MKTKRKTTETITKDVPRDRRIITYTDQYEGESGVYVREYEGDDGQVYRFANDSQLRRHFPGPIGTRYEADFVTKEDGTVSVVMANVVVLPEKATMTPELQAATIAARAMEQRRKAAALAQKERDFLDEHLTDIKRRLDYMRADTKSRMIAYMVEYLLG